MSFMQVPTVWSGDPLAGVVAFGTAGLIGWFLLAALVGSALGLLRELEKPTTRAPQSPKPRRRPRRIRYAYT